LALVSQHFPRENLQTVKESIIREAVELVCEGKRSLDELSAISLIDTLMATLTERQRSLLRREAPDRIKLKSGRNVRVHYETAKSPWIESRLQDFFGAYETPKLCGGQVSLTVHLLAPNGRAVQVTKDLSGFWKNTTRRSVASFSVVTLNTPGRIQICFKRCNRGYQSFGFLLFG